MSMRAGIGIIIDSKNSIINWIHINDAANFIKTALNNKKYQGPYNLAVEENITQNTFLKTIKTLLFPYAIIIQIPFRILKILAGNRIEILQFNKSKMSVERLKNNNFCWKYKDFSSVINEIKN